MATTGSLRVMPCMSSMPPQYSRPRPSIAAISPAYVNSGSRRRVAVYEHHATDLSQPTDANRGLEPHLVRQVIDWNGLRPATSAISLGVGVSRPRIGR